VRIVIHCPAFPLALLTDVRVDAKFLCEVEHTLVSVYCPACDKAHTRTVKESSAYLLRSSCRKQNAA
jgi:hypothetical protein